jgi:hypothetical protein
VFGFAAIIEIVAGRDQKDNFESLGQAKKNKGCDYEENQKLD